MISKPVQEILDGVEGHANQKTDESDGPFITVSQLTSKAGIFYEKIRYIVDYKEETVLRRSAIERILKRKITLEETNNVGEPLIKELVAAGYLPNNEISTEKAERVQKIINKYLWLKKSTDSSPGTSTKIIKIAAVELDKFLSSDHIDELVVDAFYKTIAGHVKCADKISEGRLQTQTYLGCRRSLLKDDEDILFYILFTRKFPEWKGAHDPEYIREISSEFNDVSTKIERELSHPLGHRIASKLKNYSIYFYFLKEIIKNDPQNAKEVIKNEKQLEAHIRNLANKKYRAQRQLIKTSGNRSVGYILITKILVGMAMELPYDIYIQNSIHYPALAINALFHPLLLLAMVKTIKMPDKENTERILGGVKHIVSGEEIDKVHIQSEKISTLLKITFAIFYLVLFGASFGAIIWTLQLMNFNIVSMGLFVFFLTLVSYFGWRIRYNAKKWKVSAEEKKVPKLVWNFFSYPVVRTGKWLSRKFASINIFVFIMDFIIEAPFKLVLGTFDAFISFLKDREEYFE